MKDIDAYYDKVNYATLWLCTVDSEEDLRGYVNMNYEMDDDEIPFLLGRDFLISNLNQRLSFDEDRICYGVKTKLKKF